MENEQGSSSGNSVLDKKKALLETLHAIKEGQKPASAVPRDLKRVSLTGEDLSGMDFSNVDLSEADLTGANLRGARFFRTKLTGVALLNADLRNADFTGADLTGANIENANAAQAGMGMACLKKARLFQTNMESVSFTKADLTEADMRCTNLCRSRIREANMTRSDFTGADMREADMSLSRVDEAIFKNADLRQTRLRAVEGFETADWIGVDIRDINFAGAYRLRRFVVDQNYLKEFRDRNKLSQIIYWAWWITSDCGRSLGRWCIWIIIQTLFFAGLYMFIGVDYGDYPTALSPLYYSVVTLTTLGYGDVLPMSWIAQVVAMIEVIIGYVMLGGLLSILSVKMARRGD